MFENHQKLKETLKNELAPRDFNQKEEQKKVWDAIKSIKDQLNRKQLEDTAKLAKQKDQITAADKTRTVMSEVV